MTPKIAGFLEREKPQTPCLVVDVDVVVDRYRRMRALLPDIALYYAVKANPAAPILQRLADEGACFDAASLPEIDAVLTAGATAECISFGNTVKKRTSIAASFELGVRDYAFDSLQELEKIAAVAPGARVACRIAVENYGARWPLSRKFGIDPEHAPDLLRRAPDLGLVPTGVSFHVGSQQTNPFIWQSAIGHVGTIFEAVAKANIDLDLVNIGGGFPVVYRDMDVPPPDVIADTIMAAVGDVFGNSPPRLMAEPGRAMVADAGVIRSEVVLVSTRDPDTLERWVYLDIGRFGGLAEAEGEAIQYEILTTRQGDADLAVIAGPTCDSHDVLYEKQRYHLPVDLAEGDLVDITAAGAYTTTYSSVGFNGFPPLAEYYV
ncbi:MAG: type III PLP-dependent enzyme [Alphaproteobacteria bacterium]